MDAKHETGICDRHPYWPEVDTFDTRYDCSCPAEDIRKVAWYFRKTEIDHCRGNHDECNCDCNGKAYNFANLTRQRDALLVAAKAQLVKECPDNPRCKPGTCNWMGDVERELAAAIAAAEEQA